MKHNKKIRKATEGKLLSPEIAKARPGAWKSQLITAVSPGDESLVHKNNQVPLLIQDSVVQEIADGKTYDEIYAKYELGREYVYRLLIRKFGSIEQMKKALTSQCFENAMAFQMHALANLQTMSGAQAVLASKLSVDEGLALEKSVAGQPETIDFEALNRMGSVLSRIEKRISGSDKTIAAA